MKTVNASWVQRTTGASWRAIELSADALIIDSKTISLESICNRPCLNEASLECTLELEVFEQSSITLNRLSREQANEINQAIELGRFTALLPKIKVSAQHIRAQLKQQKYLTQQQATSIITQARSAASCFGQVPLCSTVAEKDRKAFDFVLRIANWTPEQVSGMQQHYIDEQKSIYHELFQTIESNPLTDKQQHSCIANEQNNLVIAGAGSGKTSVMIARTAYLLSSQQAKAEQILLLAFANKAAEEMQQRLNSRLGNIANKVSTQTFHALGRTIISQVEGQQPAITLMAEDLKLRKDWVRQCFNHLLCEYPEYQLRLLEYCDSYLYPQADPFKFKQLGEYQNFMADNEIVSLKGEVMHSAQECLIANYLFRLGIEYRYKAPYPRKEKQLSAPKYQCSFFLLESQVYLEYWLHDKQGNLPSWLNVSKQQKEYDYKKSFHQSADSRYISCTYQHWLDQCLFSHINQELIRLEVDFEPLPDKAVLETLRECGAIQKISELLDDMLGRAKAGNFNEEKLAQLADKSEVPHYMHAAIKLLTPIIEHYNEMLIDAEQIDFDDMVNRAIRYVETGRFKSPWLHILVDEFQDISEPRARLVQALKQQHEQAHLFCVGDDWQSIYRFTGSDLNITIDFESCFGTTAVTKLDKTFRFNNQIGELAARFICQNPYQLEKNLTSLQQQENPGVSLAIAQGLSQKDRTQDLRKVLTAISQQSATTVSVLLLARYLFSLPRPEQLSELQKEFSNLELTCLSIHASKGKEADYVIVMEMNSGKFGFPSLKETHPLLEAMLPIAEQYPHAEERRLFYVALTRARYRCYLMADMSRASIFITQLMNENYPLEVHEFGASKAQLQPQLIPCPQCETGSLQPRKGQWGIFFGCSNYPRCKHSEQGCSECDSAMEDDGEWRYCTNEECSLQEPLCPKCGAQMKLRNSSKGSFWGCSKFKGKDNQSCNGSVPYEE